MKTSATILALLLATFCAYSQGTLLINNNTASGFGGVMWINDGTVGANFSVASGQQITVNPNSLVNEDAPTVYNFGIEYITVPSDEITAYVFGDYTPDGTAQWNVLDHISEGQFASWPTYVSANPIVVPEPSMSAFFFTGIGSALTKALVFAFAITGAYFVFTKVKRAIVKG